MCSISHSIFLVTALYLHISKAASVKKHVYFQIDEFIKQLMTSEKFDELADVIAEKAAQKIRNMDSQIISHGKEPIRNLDNKGENDPKSNEKSHHGKQYHLSKDLLSDEKSIYNHEKKKSKPPNRGLDNKRDDSNENDALKISYFEKKYNNREKIKGKESMLRDNPIDSHEKQRDSSKSLKTDETLRYDRKNTNSNFQIKSENIDMLDTQKFLQNQMASKELTLNFNHLKGEVEKHRFNVKGNSMQSKQGYDDNKHIEPSENKRPERKHEDEEDKKEHAPIKNKLKQIDSRELLISEGSENEPHELGTFHAAIDSKNKYRQTNKFNDTKNLETDINKRRNKGQVNQSDGSPITRTKKKNDSNEKSDEDIEEIKTFIDKVMDKVSMELNSPTLSKEVLEVGINRAHEEPGDNTQAGETNSNKDEKKSAKQASEEYTEYNEDSAKRLKTKFINTYKK